MFAKLEKTLVLRPYIILILLVVLAFANSLQNSFVWDDIGLIVDNPKIKLPLKEFPLIFTTPIWKLAGFSEGLQLYYRPLVYLLFVLNYKIWGMNPVGFHLTNILLHLISAVLLYKIGLLLFSSNPPSPPICKDGMGGFSDARLISLIAASVFAVHPVHNEPVGRAASGEVIFGFFVVLSLYFFLRKKKYLSFLTFFLALLAKETAVMFPFALVILTIDKKGFKKGLIEIIPYLSLIGAYLILRAAFTDTVFGGKAAQPTFTWILTMAVATLDYVKLLIIPYPVSPFYSGRWDTVLFEPNVLIAILSLLSISFLAFKLRKNKAMLFLLFFPFWMLAPVIWKVNAFPLGMDSLYIAERFLYVPAMTFSLFVSASSVKLLKNTARKPLLIGWLLVIVVFIFITRDSNRMWENNVVFFKNIIEKAPNAAFAHNNLGVAYTEQSRLDEAIEEYKIVMSLKPDDLMIHNNLGNVYYRQRRLTEALQEFQAVFNPNPSFYEDITQSQGHGSEGKASNTEGNASDFSALTGYLPRFAAVHFNLGRVYLEQGDIDKALRKFKVAAVLKPDFAEAHYNLGAVYQKQGKFDDAIKEYQTALKLKPDYADARNNLGILTIKKKQLH